MGLKLKKSMKKIIKSILQQFPSTSPSVAQENLRFSTVIPNPNAFLSLKRGDFLLELRFNCLHRENHS